MEQPMSKILWHVTMSLDGFTTGPDEDPGWAFRRPLGRVPLAAEIPGRVGAILAGRRWYDVGLRHDEASYAPYGGSVAVPVFVLTHTPPAHAERKVRFLSGDLGAAVETARAAANGKDVVLFGATLATSAIAAGLVDEVIMHIVPVFLGGGVPAWRHPLHPFAFETLEILPGDQAVTWRLRPGPTG
jgi:dihydrofolate reductase